MEKINNILERNRQTICCQGCFRLGIQQEQKRIMEIIDKRMSDFPIEENYNCTRREKYRVLLWLKQQIQSQENGRTSQIQIPRPMSSDVHNLDFFPGSRKGVSKSKVNFKSWDKKQ